MATGTVYLDRFGQPIKVGEVKMVKVRVTIGFSGPGGSVCAPGDVLTVPEQEARALIHMGRAEKYIEPTPSAASAPSPPPAPPAMHTGSAPQIVTQQSAPTVRDPKLPG